MDKNNRKLQILYKYIKANTSAIWQHTLHTCPNRSKKPPRSTQKIIPFGKWRFREKEVRRMGQTQKRIRQKGQQDYRQKNKRGDTEKWIKLIALRFQAGGRHQKRPASLRAVGRESEMVMMDLAFLPIGETTF